MTADPLSFYDSNAAAYAADGSVNPRLARFMALVPNGGKVLELGTGSGQDAKVMIDNGFVVDATDGSRELAAIASAYLGQTVRVMLFEELSAQQDYDGIYAAASLLHAPRADLPGIVTKLHAALKTGGVVWASFKSGAAEGHDGLGRYYNYLDGQELRSIFASNAPWARLELEAWEGSGFDNKPTSWIAVTATR